MIKHEKGIVVTLGILVIVMIISVVLFAKKQLNVNDISQPAGEAIPDPTVVGEETRHLEGSELESFLKSDDLEAQAFRASLEFQSSTK